VQRVKDVTESERRALNTYIRLLRAAESVTARVHAGLPKRGLSFSQYGALEALYHVGSLCQRDLATKLLKSARNITMVVDNLEKRGLVRRERGAKDRRYMHVHLTEEGARLFETVFPDIKARIVEEMAVLSEAEQQQFGAQCLRVGKRLAGP
jgi:MarR family 2-MHQ and catechol resistance regulon transcriptional repressor